MMLKIKEYETWIDDDDYELIQRFSIGISIACGKPYVNAKSYLHKMVMGITPPGMVVDHIDRNKLNNTHSNLRFCSMSENSTNRGRTKSNTSGFLGVTKNPYCYKNGKRYARKKPWVARLHRTIGYFSNPKEAHEAYLKEKEKYNVPIPVPPPPETRKILHAKGVILLDPKDYDDFSGYKWSISKKGYAVTSTFVHRIVTACPSGLVVDHVNGNTLDNRKSNLRVCSSSQNGANRKMNSNNVSGYKGVFLGKNKSRPWTASIKIDGNTKRLGCFQSPIEAASAYDAAAKEHFGEYAQPNLT